MTLRDATSTSGAGTERVHPDDKKEQIVSYDAIRMIGHGSFEAVFLAKQTGSSEIVAIKKVLQDRRYKNRELQIMKQMARHPHPFVVHLKHFFVTKGSKADDIYLNLVLEYIPETLYSVLKTFVRNKEQMPVNMIRIYMYQMARSLAHIHGMDICHRDIKPQNLLVDPDRGILKLCDFGSAKQLVPGEPNVAYICSRFYRAPELMFGATDYTTAVDVWSMGCVMAELFLGTPFFPGSSGVDQLVEVIKVLGTPTLEEVKAMNATYTEFRFPMLKPRPLSNYFKPGTPAVALELLAQYLLFVPTKRPSAIEVRVVPIPMSSSSSY